jgi:hypothetical protein
VNKVCFTNRVGVARAKRLGAKGAKEKMMIYFLGF